MRLQKASHRALPPLSFRGGDPITLFPEAGHPSASPVDAVLASANDEEIVLWGGKDGEPFSARTV